MRHLHPIIALICSLILAFEVGSATATAPARPRRERERERERTQTVRPVSVRQYSGQQRFVF